MDTLTKIGFYIGYIYAKLFIAPFPKRKAKWLEKHNIYEEKKER